MQVRKRTLLSGLGSPYFRQVGGRLVDDASSFFGHSVSMSDDGRTVAVSGVSSGSSYYSKVVVFEETNGAWTQKGAGIGNPSKTTEFVDDSRAHVSLSGDGTTLSVATIYIKGRSNPADSNAEGSVVVYEFSNGDWALTSTEYTGDAGVDYTAQYRGLVSSLNGDGTKIAIGMRYFDGPGNENIGAVLVCNVGDGNGCQTIATGNSANDYVGSSVMMSGSADPSCVVFGSVGADTANDINSGSASVYCDEYGNGEYTSRGVTLMGEAAKDEFGFSVAISSDSEFVAVGAWCNDRDQTFSKDDGGHVRVFKFDDTVNSYIQLGSDLDGERGRGFSTYYVGDKSGYSLALSDRRDDGKLRVAIGAPNNEGGNYYNGQIRLYECNPDDSPAVWVQVLDDIDGATKRESAGRSLSMSLDGNRLIFGAPEFESEDGGYYSAGSAVVYEQTEYSSSPSITPSVTPTSTSTESPSVTPTSTSTESPTLTSVPSLSPSLSEKTFCSTGKAMAFTNIQPVDNFAISHWKETTEEFLLNALSSDGIINVDLTDISVNGVPYNGRRRLFTGTGTESYSFAYTICVSKRVNLADAVFTSSLDSEVETALSTQEYQNKLYIANALADDDAAFIEHNFEVNFGDVIDAFQIRSNYTNAFDLSGGETWCLSANDIAVDFNLGRFLVRRCFNDNTLQLFSTDASKQIKMAAYPNNALCITSLSLDIFLDVCDPPNEIPDGNKVFEVDDQGAGLYTISTRNETGIVLAGLRPGREFQRVSLFEPGGSNGSLDKWVLVYGKYSTATGLWTPNQM